MASEEELAHLQRLSNNYVPEVQGDLVGERQSTAAITAEYAQADPVYVHKTTALLRKYSHYRTVRGDGNCGWRALAFGYFEALIRTGDSFRVQCEYARLQSLNNLLKTQGHDPEVFEDFVEETLGLLDRTRVDMDSSDVNGRNLLASFNDAGITSGVITHFRLIAAAWMRTNPDVYQPYIVDYTVDQYCRDKIDPFAVEIDHFGIQAVFDAIIRPAGINIEVLYLDRSPGEEVNTIRFPDPGDPVPTHHLYVPTLRLLYRPGHYDLLYEIGDVPEELQVQNASYAPTYASSNLLYSHQSLGLEQFLPGISTSGISPVGGQLPTLTHDIYQTAPFGSHALPLTPEPYPTTLYPPLRSPALHSPTLADANGQDTFRHSKFMVEAGYQTPSNTYIMEDCKTDAMRSAGESRAHFLNSRFQPELWEPGSEYRTGRESETPGRRSS